MNFVKTTLALATVTALAAPAIAVAAPTVYGKVNLAVQVVDEDGDERVTDLYNAASRLGVKGKEALADGVNVIYQAEFEVNVDDKKGDAFGKRNQYIGLETAGVGTVLFGRNDTMLKQSQGKVDLFSDLPADIKGLFKGENRIGETVTYVSPSFQGLTVGFTMALQNSDKQEVDGNSDTGYSMAAMYGDKKLKKSPVFASVAYDSEVAGYDILRATVQGKVAGAVLGAMYQNQESIKAGSTDNTGYLLSAAYKVGNLTPKVQYQAMEDGKYDYMAITAGVDYKLGAATKAYAYYTSKDFDGQEADTDYLGFGLEHKF